MNAFELFTQQAAATSSLSLKLNLGVIIAKTFIVHFSTNRAFIEPCMRQVMRQVAKFAKNNPDDKLLILGHTDLSDGDQYNQSLSERRARSVYAYLTVGGDREVAVAEWNALRLTRPKNELPSIKDSWGVHEYQHILQDLGFYPGNVNGKDDSLTREAVRAFRCKQGLPPGTTVDDTVWDALIRNYLIQDALDVPKSKFLPNCDKEILKWLGCGEKDPVKNVQTAWRPNRRVEILFVQANQLPCKVPQPDTFELPTKGVVGSNWCLGPGDKNKRCCFVFPASPPKGAKPKEDQWLRQPAEPATITINGSIKREVRNQDGTTELNPDGTPKLEPVSGGQKFVLITPDGEYKQGENPSNGEPIAARTNSKGDFQFTNQRVGVYTLEVPGEVLVRLAKQKDKDIKGNSVCKVLQSDNDSLDVIIVNIPVLREIRLPVVAHLMTALEPRGIFGTRKIRTCPAPLEPGGRSPQITSLVKSKDEDIVAFFDATNIIWQQARIRLELDTANIVREAYAFRDECEVDGNEFFILLEKCAYPNAVNLFFFAQLSGDGDADPGGIGFSVEKFGVAGCALGDKIRLPGVSPPVLKELTRDEKIIVLAHELGHFLTLEHIKATPASTGRLMLPVEAVGNRKLVQSEVQQARASRGAALDCIPLSLQVTGATQFGGKLSHEFIAIQNPTGAIAIDAVISDALLAVGTLIMTGGSPGSNDRQRKVNAATTNNKPTEIVATYTPANGSDVITTRVAIFVVTFRLNVEGQKIIRVSDQMVLVVRQQDAVVTVVAQIDPLPFCVPTNLVIWGEQGNLLPDPLGRTVSVSSTGQTMVSATVAGITQSLNIFVFEVKIAEVVAVGRNQTLDIPITVNPSPLPPGISILLELSTITGVGEAKFTSTNSHQMTITQSTTVRVQGVTASSAEDNIRLTAKINGLTQPLVEEVFSVFCDLLLPAIADPNYTGYVQPPTRGLVRPLINGRSSGGVGSDTDLTEPLNEMEGIVKSLSVGDFVYLSSWFFEPATSLMTGSYKGATNWGTLFAKKAEEGVKVRIIINDFDPISTLDEWLQNTCLTPLNAIILALPAAVRDKYKYIVSLHPAHVGFFKSLLAGQGGRPIYIASHHQKFMVVRRSGETFGFCGGLDIESRKTPARWRYTGGLIGWHDLHLMLEGPITHDLEKEFVNRWNREKGSSTRSPLTGWAGYETLTLPALSALDNTPSKRPHLVQMIRTVSSDATFSPYTTNRDDIRQVYRRAISCASQYLYFENQYFRAPELADWVVSQGQTHPDLIVIMVVVGAAAADDGVNVITQHGDHLQFETFDRIVKGLGQSRVRLYTMKNRAVHSKFLMVDDMWMTIGSANANVRSFELDSELNVSIQTPSLVKNFRARLWAHNLGESEASVATWSVAEFLSRWDVVASSNAALNTGPSGWQSMAGEGVIPFDYTAVPGEEHGSIPDALANLDLAPEGKIFADTIPPGVPSPVIV